MVIAVVGASSSATSRPSTSARATSISQARWTPSFRTSTPGSQRTATAFPSLGEN